MLFWGKWIILFWIVTAFADDDKWTVGAIQFIGNKDMSSKKLLNQMRLQPPGLFKRSLYSLATLANDIDAIGEYYHKNGYLSATAKIDRIIRNRKNMRVGIAISIMEGRQALIDKIIFVNNHNFESTRLSDWITIKSGQPFDTVLVERNRYIINDSLVSHGYLFSEVNYTVKLDSEKTEAEIIYHVFEGPIIKSGQIEIVGTSKVKNEVISDELDIKPGQVLTSTDIARNNAFLYNTGLFNYVSIEPGDTLKNAQIETLSVPVIVKVTETGMFEMLADGGYSTADGLYGNLSAAYHNLFGLGHTMSLLTRASFDVLAVELTYTYPRIFHSHLTSDITGYLQKLDEPTFSGVFGGGILNLNRIAGSFNRYRAYIQAERATRVTGSAAIDTFTADHPDNVFLIGTGVSRDTRRSLMNVGNAIFTYLNAEIAGLGFIPWSSNFYRLSGDLRLYTPFFHPQLSVSSAVYSGYVHGYSGDRVPVQEQFYFGSEGIRVIRGYSENQLTITDENGDRQGGNFALVITPFELIFPLVSIVRGAVFIEGGAVWADLSSFGLSDFHWSVGPGIRIFTPVGPIRLDYGFQLNRRFPGDGGFAFGVGLAF